MVCEKFSLAILQEDFYCECLQWLSLTCCDYGKTGLLDEIQKCVCVFDVLPIYQLLCPRP